jgi:hypothetical protein
MQHINACCIGNTPYTRHSGFLYLLDLSYVGTRPLSLEFGVAGKWFFVVWAMGQTRQQIAIGFAVLKLCFVEPKYSTGGFQKFRRKILF